MKKRFDYLVFIGRFSPLHFGHMEVLIKAAQLADNVIVLIGSSNQPRTIKNPFSFEERRWMINESFWETIQQTGIDGAALHISPLRDFKADDNVWASNVQQEVSKAVATFGWQDKPFRGGLIGHVKDESSFYLKMFPQWELVDHYLNEVVHATDIRKLYFEASIKYLESVVPNKVYSFMEKFKNKGEYTELKAEFDFIKTYKKSWAAAPYAPTFLTADAVVVQSGHVLLIKRKASPGKGLWALPGGFVNQGERIEAAMLRELKEETKIKVPVPVLKGNVKGSKIFDAPDRSLRGRTVTQAFLIELPAGELPEIRGGDDAEKAKWVPLSFVREEEMFEDHFSIICSLVTGFK